MARQIYQLRISLLDIDPPVWRRVQVPGGFTLDRIHRVIQHAMGWRDCHLHSFEVDGIAYGEPDPDGELAVSDELDVRLDVLVSKGSRLRYTYDFGDWWEHEVTVEDAFPAQPGVRYPLCTQGDRACPPEDVGGAFGYAEMLAVLADPDHPDHIQVRESVGTGFDPDTFSPDRATILLRRMA